MFDLKAPQSIFVHADGFLKACERLEAGGPGDPEFNPVSFAALVTNNAFAIELYLKCLIHMTSSIRYFKEHDLQKLFSKLPRSLQDEIEKRFETIELPEYDLRNATPEAREAVAKRSKGFRAALKDGAKAFENWRYLFEFEKDSPLGVYGLFPLASILRAVILERNPSWGNFQIKMTKLGNRIPSTPHSNSELR